MSFTEITYSIVAEFLQTVVVLDDEAYLVSPKSEDSSQEGDLEEPGPRGISSESEDESEVERSNSRKHQLDAKLLMDSFAENGQVCAVLAPTIGEKLIEHTKKIAKNADVVILDWQINKDDGNAAQTIIKELMEEDSERGGRLRLFVIYTGEPDLDELYDKLKGAVDKLNDVDKENKILGCKNSRVKFFLKKDGDKPGGTSERDLPEEVVRVFANFAGGLVSNSVMTAIHRVRENTHHVLQRFSKNMDGAFLAHRILLENKEDASEYLIELITDELKAMIDLSIIGEETVGFDVLKKYIECEQYPGKVLQIKESKKISKNQTKKLEKKIVLTALQRKPTTTKEKNDWTAAWGEVDHIHYRIHPLFYDSIEEGQKRVLEFSRISSLRFESITQNRKIPPQLKLGSIVKTKSTEDFYVCLQPLCDCERMKSNKGNPFIFGKFKKLNSPLDPFDLVVNDQGKDIRLSFQHKPFETSVFKFNSQNETCIISKKSGENWIFKPKGNIKLIWMAELRPAFAQRLIHQIMTQLTRVGLDEFEWQRLHAKSGS